MGDSDDGLEGTIASANGKTNRHHQTSMTTFDLRMKLWPAWVWFHNLSWVPLWWLRKYVPRMQLTWTPAATIRAMGKRLEYLEAKNQEYLARWGETERTLRAERMARAADGMSPEQKEVIQRAWGVRFRGSEEN